MCGIAGLVNLADGDTLAQMTEVQRHRGPDDGGLWEHRRSDGAYVGLGSRRLAILDLSPSGHMPMASEDGAVWLTYNGEVYNFRELRSELEAKGHRFRSTSDTEVVLRLYLEHGPAFVERLRGIFALGLYDRRDESLVLARDRFGVKPLYYLEHQGGIAFASELKALLAIPGFAPELDPEGLHRYLTFLWVPEPDTIVRGVRKLPPAHTAVFRNGRLTLSRYWEMTFPPAGAAFHRSEEDLAEEVRERFRRAVREQMVSDVPIGAFLSAGLDSSAIVAAMAEAGSGPVRTYTITYPPRHRIGEKTLDDPAVARRTAQRFGCDHHEIVVEPQVAELLPKLAWHMDEPVADPAIAASYLVCREAGSQVKVLLSGTGGDELFAGYRKHMAYRWSQAYRALPGVLRRGVLEPVAEALPPFRGTPFKGALRLAKKMARSGSMAPREAFLMNATYLRREDLASLYAPELGHRSLSLDPWEGHRGHFDQVREADFLNQMLYVDMMTFLPSLNLAYADKTSMAASVEARVPFLDHELAEFVAGEVPPDLKLTGGLVPRTKHIFRQAMRGLVPEEVLRQPKAGFAAPVDYWLAHDLREMVDDLIGEEAVRHRGLFDPGYVGRLVREQRSGRRDWSMQVWQLMTLEVWLREVLEGGARRTGRAGSPRVRTAGAPVSARAA